MFDMRVVIMNEAIHLNMSPFQQALFREGLFDIVDDQGQRSFVCVCGSCMFLVNGDIDCGGVNVSAKLIADGSQLLWSDGKIWDRQARRHHRCWTIGINIYRVNHHVTIRNPGTTCVHITKFH